MTNDGPRHKTRGKADQSVAADEISLFDVWDVLVRRRWIIGTIFVLVTAIFLVIAATRPATYRVSQTVEVGGGAIANELISDSINIYLNAEDSSPNASLFDPPDTVAAQIERIYVPEARESLADNDGQKGRLTSTVSAQVIDDTQLVRMTADVPASQAGVYEKLMSEAADRLIAAHAEYGKSIRQRLQNRVVQAQNAADDIRDTIAARRDEMGRMPLKSDLIEDQMQDIRNLLDRTEAIRLKAFEGQRSLSEAVSAMRASDEVRQAKQRLSALRERLEIRLPTERANLKNELASLERRLKVAEGRVEASKASMGAFRSTRVVAPPQRSGGPTGTPLAVIVALGAILGAVAGVLSAFFVEFVSAARAHRSA